MPITIFSLKKDGEKYISKNFQVKEFRSKCGSDEVQVDVDLVINFLQVIRDFYNVAVFVVSGCRSVRHNTAVKGAANSRHLGTYNIFKDTVAIDFTVQGKSPREVSQKALDLRCPCVIRYADFTHIDGRTDANHYATNINSKITKVTKFA